MERTKAQNLLVPSQTLDALLRICNGRLGDFRLCREIARGGMGVVFEALQQTLGRTVAVKVLAPQALASDRLRERFHREARTIAQLNHPHIVPIFAAGEQDGLPYFVMPLVPGV